MKTLEKIHETIDKIAKDPQVDIIKQDDNTFDIIIHGELSESFFKLGDIQKEINEICSDAYTLKTIYGEKQNATFILEKN